MSIRILIHIGLAKYLRCERKKKKLIILKDFPFITKQKKIREN
jgi:hypothetical protein